MLLTIDLHKYFVDVEGIAIATMLSLESAGVQGTKLDAPQADRIPSDDDAALGQEIFDVSVAEIESIVEPDNVGDDVWREPMALMIFMG